MEAVSVHFYVQLPPISEASRSYHIVFFWPISSLCGMPISILQTMGKMRAEVCATLYCKQGRSFNPPASHCMRGLSPQSGSPLATGEDFHHLNCSVSTQRDRRRCKWQFERLGDGYRRPLVRHNAQASSNIVLTSLFSTIFLSSSEAQDGESFFYA